MDFLLWQLADSAFPTGSFTHSSGLEAAWQQGEVRGLDELRLFARSAIWQAGYGALPLVNAAHRDPSRLVDFDRIAEAFLRNSIANRASRGRGLAFVATCARAFSSREIQAIDDDVRAGELIPHLAPVFGAVLRALNVPEGDADALYLFLTARSVFSAGVRLGILGPLLAQRLQAESHADIGRVLERCRGLDVTDLAQPAPLLDLLQGTHDRLYSRLFRS